MARRPNRPSAFDVSFPEEASSSRLLPPVSGSSKPPSASALRPGPLKRKSDDVAEFDESRAPKRQQLPPVAYYEARDNEIAETDRLVITGEDPDEFYDSDDENENEGGEPSKPIRVLTGFSIFDPKHRNEMVSLTALEEEDDGVDRQFEAAGLVTPYFVIDEDEGQEDGLVDEIQYIRLGAILRYTFNYENENEPVYIETLFAWYILRKPSKQYQPYFQHFYTPRRIAQLVISSAITRPTKPYETFLKKFISTVDSFGRTYKEEHLWDSVPEIQEAVADHDDPQQLKMSPVIKHLLRRAPPIAAGTRRPAHHRRAVRHVPLRALIGNPDLSVLKPENQTPTHVTPRIAALAQGLVREDLIVVGARPPPPNKSLEEVQKKAAHTHLCHLITKAKRWRKSVEVKREDHIEPRSRYLKSIEIDLEKYHIGDFVLVPIGQTITKPPPFLPDNVNDVSMSSTIADYFWFAKILYMDIDQNQAHVQWLEHGSQTYLEELAHPRELFYNDLCGHIPFQTIVAPVVVHECPDPQFVVHPEHYFVKFTHNKELSTFVSIDNPRRELFMNNKPPYNCHICPLIEQNDEAKCDRKLKNDEGDVDGVAYGGHNYHVDDFIFYRGTEGPAQIGYITDIKFPLREKADILATIDIRLVARMDSIAAVIPREIVKDERHVFLTNEQATISVRDLIQVCYVFPVESIPDLENWLSLSPDHFYISYLFPSIPVTSWDDRIALPCEDLALCSHCLKEKLKDRENTLTFLAQAKRHPLPTLDLFGGVGAFSRGLSEGSSCLKLTHAIEISPSAAKTLKRNSPDTLVYNQCANTMLRYSIKCNEGHHPEPPKQLFDMKTSVPAPLRPGEFRCVCAGFPCQSHSALNMYKNVDDIKSNLILNALSWIDYLKPDICYFENVPGFLNFTFDAVQAGRHKVEGGIPMGGLKLLGRALIDLGYQVRFGLLQAGHYGTPQGRVRFFVIAAIDGQPLPNLPQPTHDFPVLHHLRIKPPIGGEVRPVRVDRGIAPHPSVTIDDAISDLPRFDWKNPRPRRETSKKQRENEERARQILTLDCKKNSPHCGLRGVVEYHHPPLTTYQLVARAKPTKDLQHFTRCLPPRAVERVVSIPLAANADYRDLRPDQYEWQFANPLSSVARKNFRPGLYGRLDAKGHFPTTVTNMAPTAKQSKVLNPYCKRMVTVRELARSQGFPDSFVFESIDNNVVTMHRQIGNAVPLPLGSALGRELRTALYQKWLQGREDAIEVDDD